MAMETFEALLPALPAAKLVYLQGWGEPLLHPDFWEMARRAVAAGPRVGFTTGGSLLEREQRRALLESGIGVLGVTLAGGTPETHDRYRPGSPLRALDHNLRSLREESGRREDEGPELHIAFQLLRGNADELTDAVALARSWGAGQMVVSPLSLVLTRAMEEESFHADSVQGAGAAPLPASLKRAREAAEAADILFHAYRITGPAREATCRENVLRSCFVSARGDVSPCVMTNLGLAGESAARTTATHRFRGQDHPLETLTFGNVRDRSLKEIWRSDAARTFRKAFERRIYQGARGSGGLPSPCRHCYKLLEA